MSLAQVKNIDKTEADKALKQKPFGEQYLQRTKTCQQV